MCLKRRWSGSVLRFIREVRKLYAETVARRKECVLKEDERSDEGVRHCENARSFEVEGFEV